MSDEFELKIITPDGLQAALDRAEHYRLLNQPAQSQSICHDVLAVDPDNQRARVILLLAMTDMFQAGGSQVRAAREQADQLTDDYQRLYYSGIIAERESRAILARTPGGAFSYEGFREAMDLFEKAAELRPAGNDDAILRWNACVRAISDHKLRPRPPETEIGLE